MKALFYGLVVMFLLSGCGKANNDVAQVKQEVMARSGTPQDSARTDKLLAEGAALLVKGYIPAALKAFDEAIKSNPNDPRGYIALGEAYIRIKKMDPAIETFKMILNFSPENPEAYYLIGMAHGLKGERNIAAQYAQKSMEFAQAQKNEEVFIRSAAMLNVPLLHLNCRSWLVAHPRGLSTWLRCG